MTATKAWVTGSFLLAGLVVLALSVGTQGFGWGDGGSLVLLRAPRVLAALAAGLTAAGLPGGIAVSSVLLFRLITFWIPTIPGYAAFNWLTKKGCFCLDTANTPAKDTKSVNHCCV